MKVHKSILVFSIISIMIIGLSYSCTSTQGDVKNKLQGVWLRADGTYKIEIVGVNEDGKLISKYYNPNPINVGKSGWRIQNDELQIFVELQDENYPGCIYQLSYDETTGLLIGTYYQAVSKETYEVSFKKLNK